MGLEVRKNRDGSIRQVWYACIKNQGRTYTKCLDVAIKGEIPLDEHGKPSLKLKGDEAFEKSRKEALKAFHALKKETQLNPTDLQEKAYVVRTGISLAGVPFNQLIDKWLEMKRQRIPTTERIRITRSTFQKFGDFAHNYALKKRKKCYTLNDVTPEIASAWFESIKNEYAWATVKDMIHLMSGAFKRWATNGQPNPFADIVLRGSKDAGEEKKRTERKALTPIQFERLLECSKGDERLYPLILCASYTGMRIGDICRMKVEDVDLKANTIDCITAKAGVRVVIPILSAEFRTILVERCTPSADPTENSPYVFPWACKQYEKNNKVIIRGVKKYFAQAVYADELAIEDIETIEDEAQKAPVDIVTACKHAKVTEKRAQRIIEVYNRSKAGERGVDIAKAMGIARGQVSAYLTDAEELTGETLRPKAEVKGYRKGSALDLLKRTRVERRIGKYSASIWGWHNLRHHFITCALNQGVPIHKVSAIVGHSTTEMTADYADLRTATNATAGTPVALPPSAPTMTAEDFISTLNEAERKELARKLLGL